MITAEGSRLGSNLLLEALQQGSQEKYITSTYFWTENSSILFTKLFISTIICIHAKTKKLKPFPSRTFANTLDFNESLSRFRKASTGLSPWSWCCWMPLRQWWWHRLYNLLRSLSHLFLLCFSLLCFFFSGSVGSMYGKSFTLLVVLRNKDCWKPNAMEDKAAPKWQWPEWVFPCLTPEGPDWHGMAIWLHCASQKLAEVLKSSHTPPTTWLPL